MKSVFFARGIVALLSLFMVVSLFAESRKKSDSPAPPAAPSNTAQVRVWKCLFPSKRAIHVVARTSGKKTATTELIDSADALSLGEYISVPSGNCGLEITETSNPKNKLATINFALAGGSYCTVLLRETDNEISAEVIQDNGAAGPSGEISVRNLLPDLTQFEINAGPDLHTKISAPEGFLHLKGLPLDKIQIETTGTDSTGKSFQWSNEIDFSQSPKATILILRDTYGRIRPKILTDGPGKGAASSDPGQ